MISPTPATSDPPGSREKMVHRAQAGDSEAFGELVKRFRSTVYAVAMSRVCNPTEAEELAQEVFIHGMKKLRQLRDPRCIGGWLRQITVRLARSRRSRCRLPVDVLPGRLDQVASPDAGPLNHLILSEERRRLRTTLRRLKPLDREMLEAFYLRSCTLREMSREFSAPIGTIKRRLPAIVCGRNWKPGSGQSRDPSRAAHYIRGNLGKQGKQGKISAAFYLVPGDMDDRDSSRREWIAATLPNPAAADSCS
jgi:RNA polymerase sigma-70 factor (ECF subfamily)